MSALLSGSDAVEAIAAARRVADGLRDPAALPDGTLFDGAAGVAVLHAALAYVLPGEGFETLRDAHLEAAADAVGETIEEPGLGSGFAGVAWAMEHIRRVRGDEGDDPCEEIDDAVLELLRGTFRHGHDLLYGAGGLAVYAAERLPRPAARACLQAAFQRVAEAAEHTPHGARFFCPPILMPEEMKTRHPRGGYALGLAHGVACAIGTLSLLTSTGVVPAAPLLEETVNWLLSQRLPSGSPVAFPLVAGEGPPPHPRPAWCHGDLGVAMALWRAGAVTRRMDWSDAALSILRDIARIPPEHVPVADAGLCHGAAGLLHALARAHAESGDGALGMGARTWFGRTMALEHPDASDAPFPRFDGAGWQSWPGLLSGGAGVALALLAAATGVEPRWDRVLLLSVA